MKVKDVINNLETNAMVKIYNLDDNETIYEGNGFDIINPTEDEEYDLGEMEICYIAPADTYTILIAV
jgi:hypothetical protein